MRKILLLLILFLFSALICPFRCSANEDILFTPDYAKRFLGDLKALAVSPGQWNKNEWLVAGGILAATFASIPTVDGPIRTYYRTNRSPDLRRLSDAVTHFGDYKYQVPLLSSFWLGGILFKSDTLNRMAGDATEASIIAALLINPVICYMSGRALPAAEEKSGHFRPFTWNRYSFASGHSAAAFAMVSALDVNLREKFGYWQTPILYGIAFGVAQSRMYDKTHYLSDVILGSAIGMSVGHWVASRHNKTSAKKKRNLTFLPSLNGMTLAYKF